MSKLDPKFKGPFEIVTLLPGDRFELKCRNSGRKQTAPKDRLRRWRGEWSEDLTEEIDENEIIENWEDVPRECGTGQGGRLSVEYNPSEPRSVAILNSQELVQTAD